MTCEYRLPESGVWVSCTPERAIYWLLGGGLVRCSDG